MTGRVSAGSSVVAALAVATAGTVASQAMLDPRGARIDWKAAGVECRGGRGRTADRAGRPALAPMLAPMGTETVPDVTRRESPVAGGLATDAAASVTLVAQF